MHVTAVEPEFGSSTLPHSMSGFFFEKGAITTAVEVKRRAHKQRYQRQWSRAHVTGNEHIYQVLQCDKTLNGWRERTAQWTAQGDVWKIEKRQLDSHMRGAAMDRQRALQRCTARTSQQIRCS
jgi:hypothetical protein